MPSGLSTVDFLSLVLNYLLLFLHLQSFMVYAIISIFKRVKKFCQNKEKQFERLTWGLPVLSNFCANFQHKTGDLRYMKTSLWISNGIFNTESRLTIEDQKHGSKRLLCSFFFFCAQNDFNTVFFFNISYKEHTEEFRLNPTTLKKWRILKNLTFWKKFLLDPKINRDLYMIRSLASVLSNTCWQQKENQGGNLLAGAKGVRRNKRIAQVMANRERRNCFILPVIATPTQGTISVG